MKKHHGKAKLKSSELSYVVDSKAAILRSSSRIARLTLYLMFALIIATLVWSYYAIIDVTIIAQGKVITSSNLQIIQNLEGGIIKSINASEGKKVLKGEILATLDDTRFASLYNKELARKTVLEIEIIRLQAEAEGKGTITFPPKLEKKYPTRVKEATELFKKNYAALNTAINLLQHNLTLLEKELSIVSPLAQKGAMSQLEEIRLNRELNNIKSRINEKAEISRTNARNELNKLKGEYTLLSEQIFASKDRARRTIMRSPVNGIINKVYITTIGEVVRPGEKIMDIVPLNDQLTLIIKIAPSDIGFINISQKAIVTISAYDFSVYGSLDATVTYISADTLSDKKGNDFYEVKLQTKLNYLGTAKKPLRILPGMAITVNIVTEKRSIMSYLVRPFIDLNQLLFNSR